MTDPYSGTDERSDRILVEKLRLLYRANFAVPANLIVALIAAIFLHDTFPRSVLIGWLVATALVTTLRIFLHKHFMSGTGVGRCNACWASRFCIGSLTSGLLWGALCLGLPAWGQPNQYVFLTLVAAGMSAGALTTIGSYFPAFLVYAGPFVVPLALVSLAHPQDSIATNGSLVLLYMLVIGVAARNMARSVNRTIELQVDNEILLGSLNQAHVERDDARTEKWSTLGHLSHELRTPLNAILGFSEAMREQFFGPLGDDRYKHYASDIHTSGQQLLTLTSEILQLSQGEAGELELNESLVDLAGVVGKCVEAVLPDVVKEDLTLKTVVASQLPFMRADDTKIRQMLFNLVSNAIKFTPPRGEISIEASPAPGGGIDLVVRDTGIGMKAEDIPRAMQPFGRLKSPLTHTPQGMGLGLPICRRLAELHGAEFIIHSEPDEGTECRVSFPASRCIGTLAA